MGERREYNPHHDPRDEDLRQETRGSLERSEENLTDYNERENQDHWNMKTICNEAQQAVEHPMKGLLTAYNDDSRFRHDLSRTWAHIDANLAWRPDEEGQRGKQAVRDLLEHITFPNTARPGQILNWLTAYAEGDRYEGRPQDEGKELQYLINEAVAALQDEALHQRAAVRENLFPNGKPAASLGGSTSCYSSLKFVAARYFLGGRYSFQSLQAS